MTRRDAFTLLELLVTMAIIAILGILILAGAKAIKSSVEQSVDLANLRAIGTGCALYAADNNAAMPRVAYDTDCWMRMIWPYIPEKKVFASPSDPGNCIKSRKPVFSFDNNTSYVMNGFNDLGDYNLPTFSLRYAMVGSPTSVIFFGLKANGDGNRYMDLMNGDQKTAGDYRRYNNGSVYLMVDGSSRRIHFSDYDHALWLARKDWKIP
ncbi:MAG: prepilin-type N-terminal cleavage/methylation domain-containing protein [Terrimicrobiaceae bacterium]